MPLFARRVRGCKKAGSVSRQLHAADICDCHLQLNCVSSKHRLLKAASLVSDEVRPQCLQSHHSMSRSPLHQNCERRVTISKDWNAVAAAHQVALSNQSYGCLQSCGV